VEGAAGAALPFETKPKDLVPEPAPASGAPRLVLVLLPAEPDPKANGAGDDAVGAGSAGLAPNPPNGLPAGVVDPDD
jgi:hypothetical protein